jgi:hypothetical protein
MQPIRKNWRWEFEYSFSQIKVNPRKEWNQSSGKLAFSRLFYVKNIHVALIE